MVTDPYVEDEQPGIDIAGTLRAAWAAAHRNRYLVLAIVGTAIALGIVVTMLATPRYKATTSVRVDQEQTRVLGTEDAIPAVSAQEAERLLQTQVDVVSSRRMALQVIDSLRLASNDDFVLSMHAKPLDAPIGNLTLAQSKREQLIALLLDNLDVNLPGGSRVLNISFESPSPNQAARIANSFAANFILLNVKWKFDQTAYARGFLSNRLATARQRLEESERNMLDYARSVGLIDASAGIGASEDGAQMQGPRSLVTSDLVALNGAYSAARAARVAAEQRWRQAQQSDLMSLPEVQADPTYARTLEARTQVASEYAKQRPVQKPDFPAVQQLGAQLTSLDRDLTHIATAVRSSLRDRYETALRQEQALAANVIALKRDTQKEQERSVKYNILKREADTNRALYDGLLQRFKELSAQAGLSPNNISIVDAADTPAFPVYPKPVISILAALVLGLVLSGGVIFIREKFDDLVRSPEDVQRKLGLPLLSTVPLLGEGEKPLDALAKARSSMSESYAALRTSLELIDPRGLPSTLLFTSSRSGEGKSTSSFATARDFARTGRRVVLIDADLRRPSLHRLLGLNHDEGLSNALAQQRPVMELLHDTGIPNLSFLSAGPLPPNPADLLSATSLRRVLLQLLERFELVIIDGPPVFGLADAVVLASVAGGTVFVIETNGAQRGHAKAALRRLRTGNSNILGALLTKQQSSTAGYGYSYYAYDYGADAPARD